MMKRRVTDTQDRLPTDELLRKLQREASVIKPGEPKRLTDLRHDIADLAGRMLMPHKVAMRANKKRKKGDAH